VDHPQAGVELAFTVFRSLLHLSSHWKDRSTWINSDEVINVARLPESHKCISYDHEGNQPATKIWRSTAPILDETVISMDAKGKPVEPGRASFFLISQYGPGHKFLRDPSSRKSIVKFVLTADLVVSKNQIFFFDTSAFPNPRDSGSLRHSLPPRPISTARCHPPSANDWRQGGASEKPNEAIGLNPASPHVSRRTRKFENPAQNRFNHLLNASRSIRNANFARHPPERARNAGLIR